MDIENKNLERLSDSGVNPEMLINAVFRQISAGILVLSPDGEEILYSNPQMSDIWGSDSACAGILKGRWKGFRSSGEPIGAGEWPHERVLAGEDQAGPQIIEIVREDGNRSATSICAVPLKDADGDLVGVVVTCQDVSAQTHHRASRKFLNDADALLATSKDPLATLRNIARLAVPALADWCAIDILDANGEVQRVAVEHIDESKAAAASTLARRFPPDIDADVGMGAVIREGRSHLLREVDAETLRRLSAGESHGRLLQTLGIRSAVLVPMISRGRTIGAIGLVSSQPSRRYGQEDLEVAEQLASKAALAIDNSRLLDASQAAAEAKSDFLAVMSHELRTPLTAIIGYSELLQLGVPEPVTERQLEQAERIEVSARQLLQMIEEILTLVTLQSGEGKLRRRDIEISDIVQRAVSVIEPMARAKGLPLIVDNQADDMVIDIDPDKLLQILLNLLSNAVKFTDQGETGLTITCADGIATFEVWDTGIGVDTSHLDQIFEPFWQAERPITRKAGGTGLGLTIAMRLTEMMRGNMEVESAPGGGTRFRVHFPVDQAA